MTTEPLYSEQNESTKRELDELKKMNFKEYQLKVIKRQRKYPQKGDVFVIEPLEGISFWGIVVNNHVCNINGEDLLVVMIFKEKAPENNINEWKPDINNLLIEPSMVGKEYWTKGYFYTVYNIPIENSLDNYGFYCIFEDRYFDEWGKKLRKEPKIVGTFGVSTISGIAYKINVELIIEKQLMENRFTN